MTQLPPDATGPSPARRVLLVEDNEAASKGLAKLLQAHGFEVATARDGASALAALASGPPPDFLLTDMQLPDLDGRELALRARELDPPPRVGLITGWDIEPAVDDPSAWGIEWVLTKPVDMQELIDKLNQPPPPPPAPTPPAPDQPSGGA
jgi:CheY-like chemotaxis protein